MRYESRKAIVVAADMGNRPVWSAPVIIRTDESSFSPTKHREAFLEQEAYEIGAQQIRQIYKSYVHDNPEALLGNMRKEGLVSVLVPVP